MSDIIWLNNKSNEEGIASFHPTNITFNMSASSHLRDCYRVRVGIDANHNVIIEPLNKEMATRGDIDVASLYHLEERPSYCRICSSALLRQIMTLTGIDLGGSYKQYATKFDSAHHYLMIILSKEVN